MKFLTPDSHLAPKFLDLLQISYNFQIYYRHKLEITNSMKMFLKLMLKLFSASKRAKLGVIVNRQRHSGIPTHYPPSESE